MKQLVEQGGWDDLFSNDVPTTTTQPKSDNKTKSDKSSKKSNATLIPPADLINPNPKPGTLKRSAQALNDVINPDLLADLDTATSRAQIGDVMITTAFTGHSPHTVSGTISRHYSGNAVDISIIDGKSYNTNKKLFTTLGWLLVVELQKLGYKFGEGSNTRSYLWQTMTGGNHYDHVHVSIKSKENYTGSSPISGDNKTGSGSDKNIVTKKTIKLTKELRKKILKKGPGPYFKQPPSAAELRYHNKLQQVFEKMYNIITVNPNKYFWKTRKWYNDREDLAAKWFYETYFKVERPKIAPFSELHPIDQYNLVLLDAIVNRVHTAIWKGDSYQQTVNYIYYENKKWATQKLKVIWDYM